MAKAEAAKPVPIRLAQRYPNGSMISYSARAIAHDEISACVLVNEEFETGTKLSIMAPFLDGLTSARVFSVTRSRTQPGYFEVFLQIGEATDAAEHLKANSQNHKSGKRKRRAGTAEESQAENASRAKPQTVVPELVSEAAHKLSDELAKLPAPRLFEALNGIPSGLRAMSLLAAVAAAIHLLEKKGHVEARRLLGSLTDKGAQSEKEAVKQ